MKMLGDMRSAGPPLRVGRPIRPIPGESLDGYVARAAADNWIEKVIDLSGLAGVRHAASPLLSTHCWNGLPALADCLGIDVEELRLRSYPQSELRAHQLFFGVPVNRGELEIYKRRFAPKSLALSGHHRALWHLRSFPFCHETWQYLVDRCPRCDRTQRWLFANGIDRCDYCVADLTSAAAAEVPLDQRDALTDAIGLVHPDIDRAARSLAKLPEPLSGLDAGAVYELLFCVASMLAAGMDRIRHNRAGERPDDTIITETVAKAWGMLTQWPHGPQAHFIERILTATKRHDDGNGARSTRFLKLPANGQVTPPVAKVIGELRASIDLSGPSRGELLQVTCDIREASKTLGIGAQPLTAIRRKGGLDTVFLMNNDHATVRFDAREVEDIGRALKARYGPEQVARKFGLPVYAVEQLMAMKLIGTFADRFCVERYGSRQTTRLAVSQFEERLMAASTVAQFDRPVTLAYASRTIGGRLKPWGPIFDALISGSVAFSMMDGSDRLAHRVVVDGSALKRFEQLDFDVAIYPDTTRRKIIKRVEAGEILNLDPPDVAKVAAELPAYGGDQKKMSLEDVLELAKRHISSRELGCRLTMFRDQVRVAEKAGVPWLGPAGWCRVQAEAKLLSRERPIRASRGANPRGWPRQHVYPFRRG